MAHSKECIWCDRKSKPVRSHSLVNCTCAILLTSVGLFQMKAGAKLSIEHLYVKTLMGFKFLRAYQALTQKSIALKQY